MTMDLRLPLAGALAAALAAPVTASAAPTFVTPLKRCYVSVSPTVREPVDVAATGFVPTATINVFEDGQMQTPAHADAIGNVVGSLSAPYIATGQRLFTLQLIDPMPDRSDQMVAAISKVTALSVTQIPAKADTQSRVRWRGRGFTDPTSAVYAHYVFAGKLVRTVRVAKPFGDCGQFSIRRREFPFKQRPHRGTWTVQFDQQKVYSAQPKLFTTLKITVTARPGRR